MKKPSLVFFFTLFFLVSCNPQTIKGELPPEQEMRQTSLKNQEEKLEKMTEADPLYFTYETFRFNQMGSIDKSYRDADPGFLAALSNEFNLYTLDREDYLKEALEQYQTMIPADSKETNGFLMQRIGITYYKLDKMQQANAWLSRSLLQGTKNPELYYYRALLSAYYSRDFRTAAWYLKRIPLDETLFPTQDILYSIGKMEEEQGHFGKAERYYKHALSTSPSRFHLYYDLLPFYKKWGQTAKAQSLVDSAFEYLSTLTNTLYMVKGYSQKLAFNQAMKKDTFHFKFEIPKPYTYYPHLYYFMKSPYFAKKRYASGLILPINEKKVTRSDVLMYLTYERLQDTPEHSGIVIIGGGLSITNFRYAKNRLYTPIDKHFFYTNVISFISPTNQHIIVTNYARPTNHKEYVLTNVDNSLFKADLPFDYYLDAQTFDMDNDRTWETIVFGIQNTNTINMTIFYPRFKKMDVYELPIRRHDSELYIQDMDNDGKNEVYLLGDQVYHLIPKRTVK